MSRIELFCIKDFQKSDIVNFKEGETYIGELEKDIIQYKDEFFIVYPHDVTIPNNDYNYQIFNYKGMPGLPCIEEYFITRHELREEQIKSILDD